jgi:hypothetical protein
MSTAAHVRAAAAIVALLAPLGGHATDLCADVLGEADAASDRVLRPDPLPAACGKAGACTTRCRDGHRSDDRYTILGSFDGGFSCPGKRERIVSLFPCNDLPGMHGVAGKLVLLQATAKGWRQRSKDGGSVLETKDCKVERAIGRDVIVCKYGWGPYQGVVGTSLCIVSASSSGTLRVDCPVRVSSDDDDLPEIGVVKILAGSRPREAMVDVEVADRHLLLLLDEAGLHVSPRTRAELKKHPILRLEVDSK